MCELARISRASYYRFLQRRAPQEADVELRAEMQRISLAYRRYGYRRVTAELRRRGWIVNHKKVMRLRREDNLLAVRRRAWMTTTDSRHASAVFPNLAPCFDVTGPNQLWVADITYIRLQGEFVFLAVVLDVFSRRVVGWTLDRHLQASLALSALRRAVVDRRPPPGLVHHSDRGVQYACDAYVSELLKHGMVGSMSRPGCPWDNAFCESFMRTLKEEEIHCSEYATMEDLAANLGRFINDYYNAARLHSALGYLPPADFELLHRKEAAARLLPG